MERGQLGWVGCSCLNLNAKRECVGGGKGQALKKDYKSRT